MVTVASETLNTSARLSLESRLGMLTTEQLDAVNEGFGLTDTAKSSVLQNQQNATDGTATDATTTDDTTADTETDASISSSDAEAITDLNN